MEGAASRPLWRGTSRASTRPDHVRGSGLGMGTTAHLAVAGRRTVSHSLLPNAPVPSNGPRDRRPTGTARPIARRCPTCRPTSRPGVRPAASIELPVTPPPPGVRGHRSFRPRAHRRFRLDRGAPPPQFSRSMFRTTTAQAATHSPRHSYDRGVVSCMCGLRNAFVTTRDLRNAFVTTKPEEAPG